MIDWVKSWFVPEEKPVPVYVWVALGIGAYAIFRAYK